MNLIKLSEQIQEDVVSLLESQYGEIEYTEEVKDMARKIIIDNFETHKNTKIQNVNFESFCLHDIKWTKVEDKRYNGICNKCNQKFESEFCSHKYCPVCNKTTETSCSACGCGTCFECNYRFVCVPVNLDSVMVRHN